MGQGGIRGAPSVKRRQTVSLEGRILSVDVVNPGPDIVSRIRPS